ncbi:MAG: glycosyltransferase [Verrucomicrobiota bacterium]
MTDWLFLLLSLLFWGSSLLIVHTYVGYPILISLFAKGKSLPEDRFVEDEEFPEVTVLMAVYNEEEVLEKTLKSVLASDYPQGKLRVLVGSDGSTDRSHQIVETLQQNYSELELRVFAGRNGKIRIVNRLAREARRGFEEVDSAAFILCDANVCWESDLLKRLISHFKRGEIGVVGASVIDVDVNQRGGIGAEEQSYVSQENRTKFNEGVLWGATMGAFGACYAMRAPLFRPVPENYIVDDFFLTMSALEQGKKAIVDLEAECHEAVSSEISEEFRRKKRIATGNFQNLQRFEKFIRPWVGGLSVWFAFWSHKGLRWVGPLLLAIAFISSFLLAVMHPFYLLPYATLVATAAIGLIDHFSSMIVKERYIRAFRFVRYFYSMNGAIVLGFLAFCRGVHHSIWEPTQRVAGARVNSTQAMAES